MNHPASTRPAPWLETAARPEIGAATLRKPNGSGIAQLFPMPNCPLSSSTGHPRHEPDQTIRALQAWPDHASEPPRDGAAAPQPRGTARHGAEPAGDRLLWAARLRRP